MENRHNRAILTLRRAFAWVIISGLLLSGCMRTPVTTNIPTTLPASATAIERPDQGKSATATPTPAPSHTPTPLPSPTPYPTPDPRTLLATAKAGMDRVQSVAGEATIVCLRYEDTDADGEAEWLALAHQAGENARMHAFILDGDRTHTLAPAHPKPGVPDVGFGEYPTCDVEVHDINADGKAEIAIFGYARDNETLLHLYVWEEAGYRLLGKFSGDAGIQFVDADGDLAEEIWEGYRVREAPTLAWHVIFTWDGLTYGWTADRYDWYFLDRPQTYPTHKPAYAVVAFYLALNDRDLPGAFSLLQPRAGREYDTWALGYATTLKVQVGDAHAIPGASDENNARVSAMVTAWDNQGGVIVGQLWNVVWDTVRTADGWRLVDADAEKLEEWKATYWP